MNTPKNNVNIEIGGLPLLASEITPTEAFNRYELNTKKLIGELGAITHQGEYILREFSFKTSLPVEADYPDKHYKVLKGLIKEPVDIVCPEMDALYKGMVVFKPVRETPEAIKLEVNVKEVPSRKKID